MHCDKSLIALRVFYALSKMDCLSAISNNLFVCLQEPLCLLAGFSTVASVTTSVSNLDLREMNVSGRLQANLPVFRIYYECLI